MLIRINLLFSVILFLILFSCGSTNNLSSKQYLISDGQTKNDVLNILGPPGNKQFNGKDEAWQYCQTKNFGEESERLVIWFYDGIVTGMTSYRSNYGDCTKGYRTVNWQSSPDRTIEIRHK